MRLRLIKAGIIILGLFFTAGCKDSKVQLPNIITIYIDDLGYGDLGCYGATDVGTPNIDKIADGGLLFTNAYATASICTPSRYSLLTGMYHWRNAISWNVGKINDVGIAPGNAGLIIDTAQVTLPKVLKAAGYITGVVGKWHLGLGGSGGPDWNSEIMMGPQDVGFDYSFILPATADRVPCVYVENRRVAGLDPADPIRVSYDKPIGNSSSIFNNNVTPDSIVSYDAKDEKNEKKVKMYPSFGHDQTIINGIPRIGYMTGGISALWEDDKIAETITQKALDYIDKNKAKPFFLYLATHNLHVPRVPGKIFAGKSKIGIYGDVIMEADWTVGQILNKIDDLKLGDNTIVILTSDNGPVLDDGYNDGSVTNLKEHRPSGVLREGKYSAFEGGTRVPFIIRWPSKIRNGKTEALFSQVDILASIASIIGNKSADHLTEDSRNLSNVLLGRNNQGRKYIIQQNMNTTLSIVEDGWKYIEPAMKPEYNFYTNPVTDLGNRSQPQLYNISQDPEETKNLSAENIEKVKSMAASLEKIKNLHKNN